MIMITNSRPIFLRHAGALLCAALLAVTAFNACDKKDPATEPVDEGLTVIPAGKPMLFQSAPATKADATTLPADTSFGVFAFYQAGVIGETTGAWATGGWTPAFMFNQEVEYDGSDYSYTPVKYWPYNEENTISFWAYYPYAAQVVVLESAEASAKTYTSESTTGLPVVKFTVPADGATDFMTADLVKDQVYDNTNSGTAGTVKLTFHHRLASVRFMAKTDIDYTTGEFEDSPITFTITEVKVLNDYTAGTLEQTPADTGADVAEWTEVSEESADGHSASSESLEVTSEAADYGDAPLYLLPQAIEHDGEQEGKVSVSVTYTMSFSNGHTADPITTVVELDAAKDAEGNVIASWDPNKQYVYTIVLTYDGIYFVVQVDPLVEHYYGEDGYDDYKVIL